MLSRGYAFREPLNALRIRWTSGLQVGPTVAALLPIVHRGEWRTVNQLTRGCATSASRQSAKSRDQF